mmetsp:Transcript_21396/g.39843  ORF Transcript_21396/g.39843 Transcript_21396/m.39843 type:complete len:471 (+) Transcript_21396:222-1634(+)
MLQNSNVLEEHVLLRVTPELADRMHAVVKPNEENREEVELIAEGGEKTRDVIFRIGQDKYYAKLRDLPSVVETLKTKKSDSGVVYKSANVSQILEVSNAKVGEKPRPDVSELADDGLTPPMAKARSKRFHNMDRAVKHDLPPDQGKDGERARLVRKMDNELYEIVENLSKQNAEVFVHEEVIEMEPFMHYWDTKTVIHQGSDNFLTESRKAYDLAYERYVKKTGGNVKAVVPASKKDSRPSIQMIDAPAPPLPPSLALRKSETSRPISRPSPPSPTPLGRGMHTPPPPPAPPVVVKKHTAPTGLAPTKASLPRPSPPPQPSPGSSSTMSAPQPSPSPQYAPAPSPPATVDTPAGGYTPGAVATPGATPGATPSGTPGMPQPSPSPLPGEDTNPEVQELRAKLRAAAKKAEEARAAYETANRKWKKEKNIQLKKRLVGPKEEKFKAYEAARAEHSVLDTELRALLANSNQP